MQNSFTKNTTILAIGNIVTQIISIALITFITRIYTTEEFGEFSIITSFSMILMPVSNLRYNAAIILPKSDVEGEELVRLSFFLNTIFICFLYLVIFIFDSKLLELTKLTDVSLLYLLPIIVMTGGWQLIIEAWSLRKKAFVPISIANIAGSTSDRLIGILMGLVTNLNAMGLLIGRFIGLFLNVILMLIGTNRLYKNNNIFKPVTLKSLYYVGKKYKRFPIYSFSELLQQLARQAPILLLGIFYSPTVAGLYALTFRVLAVPVQIIGAAIGRSFSQRAAQDIANGKDISYITMRLFKYLLITIVVPMTILAIISTDVFAFVFGNQWHDSGRYLQYVVPVFIFSFLLRALGSLFDILQKQKDQFIFAVTLVSVTVGSFLLERFGASVKTVLLCYSVTMSLTFAYRIVWLLVQVNIDKYAILKVIIYMVIDLFIFTVPFYFLIHIVNFNIYMIIISACLLVMIYYLVSIHRDAYLKEIILGMFFVRHI